MEAAGLSTVALTSNLVMTERIAPPRALWCDFPLGRPLGVPLDVSFQHRVLAAAFSLLSRIDVPVLERYPEVIHDEAEAPLACPLPPRFDAGVHPAVDEARAMRPAWERARAAAGGRTQVGRVLSVDDIPDAIEAFVRVAEGVPWPEAGIPDDPASALMDVRLYYEEVAVGLSDHVPAARAAESWMYRSTATGALMKQVLEQLAVAIPPFPALFYVVPWSQQTIVPIPGAQ
jgi:hypothetical protein